MDTCSEGVKKEKQNSKSNSLTHAVHIWYLRPTIFGQKSYREDD